MKAQITNQPVPNQQVKRNFIDKWKGEKGIKEFIWYWQESIRYMSHKPWWWVTLR